MRVSTHSRPKAAGHHDRKRQGRIRSFNTQPPEGGWSFKPCDSTRLNSFNTQPPEGGWIVQFPLFSFPLSFNTQPPEGGWKHGRESAA